MEDNAQRSEQKKGTKGNNSRKLKGEIVSGACDGGYAIAIAVQSRAQFQWADLERKGRPLESDVWCWNGW
jgi:hypothetical protein